MYVKHVFDLVQQLKNLTGIHKIDYTHNTKTNICNNTSTCILHEQKVQKPIYKKTANRNSAKEIELN